MTAGKSVFNQCLYFSSSALSRKVEKMAEESWKKIGLSPSHAYVLTLVINEPGIQAGAIADQLLLTPSTITRLIQKLEEKKLLTRVSEGKATLVYPTAKSKSLYPKMKACLNEFYEKYTSILGKEESARMVKNMNMLNDKL